jgi:hypothetical protein
MQRTRAVQRDVRIEYMPLNEIRHARRNPKAHDGEEIRKSVGRFGFVSPVILNERTGRLVAGHGRLEELRGLLDDNKAPPDGIRVDASGDWLVPVVRGVRFRNEQEAEAYLLADNRTSELGGWDNEELTKMLDGMSKLGEDHLAGTGFDMREVERLIKVRGYERSPGGDELEEEPPPVDVMRTLTIELDEKSYYWAVQELEAMAERTGKSRGELILDMIRQMK